MSQVQIETNISRITPVSSLLGGHGLQSTYSQIAGEQMTFGSGQHRILTSTDHMTGLPQDPFNDHSGMYVPENSIHLNGNLTTLQQQEEMFQDIVANTNPDLISVIPSRDQVAMASLCNTQVDGFFSVKRQLMEQRSGVHARSSSSDRLYASRRNLDLVSEDMPISDKEGFDPYLDERIFSEIEDDENSSTILDMIDGRDRQACTRRAQRTNRGRALAADLYMDGHSDYNPFEQNALEYENCAENRSCCGNEEFDNVSASTLAFSFRGSERMRASPFQNILSPQKDDNLTGKSSPVKASRTTKSQIHTKECIEDEDLKEFELDEFAPSMQKRSSHVQTLSKTFEFPSAVGTSMTPANLHDEEQVLIYTMKQSAEAALAYKIARDTDQDFGHGSTSTIFKRKHSHNLPSDYTGDNKQILPSIFEIGDTYSLTVKTPNAASSVRITGDISNTKAEDSPKLSSQDKLKARHKVIKKKSTQTQKAAKPRGFGNKRLNQKLFRQRAVVNFRMHDNISKDGDGLKFQSFIDTSEKIVERISNKTQKGKYYQNFDFFFKRSCFRVMTEFYKDRFNAFYTERLAQLKVADLESYQTLAKAGGLMYLTRAEMDELVTEFLKYTFGIDLGSIPDQSLQLHSIMILFSHRYTKNDLFLLEEPIEFDIIRDVMYKYSKKAQDKYFAHPVECFMFAAFALSEEGQMYLRNKPDNVKDGEKLAKMLKDLAQLKSLAVQSLKQFAVPANAGDAAQTQAIDPNSILGTQLLSHLLKLTKGKL